MLDDLGVYRARSVPGNLRPTPPLSRSLEAGSGRVYPGLALAPAGDRLSPGGAMSPTQGGKRLREQGLSDIQTRRADRRKRQRVCHPRRRRSVKKRLAALGKKLAVLAGKGKKLPRGARSGKFCPLARPKRPRRAASGLAMVSRALDGTARNRPGARTGAPELPRRVSGGPSWAGLPSLAHVLQDGTGEGRFSRPDPRQGQSGWRGARKAGQAACGGFADGRLGGRGPAIVHRRGV